MKITITTSVEQNHETVFEGFTRALFLELAPPFPPVNLLRFDGCKKGDLVQLELNMLLFKQRWDALIVESFQNEQESSFVDIGTTLPIFLKNWKHHHRIVKNKNGGSDIIDDIEFKTPFWLLDYLMYPSFYWQFWRRKAIYKIFFKK